MKQRECHVDTEGGFSLVELMVAMTIGLVISLAIFSSLNTFEGRRRTSTSINDVNQAGSYAVYALDKWIRSAGSGFVHNTDGAFDYLLCKLTAARNNAQILPRTAALPAPFANVTTGTANEFRLIPFLILPDQTTPGISGKNSDALLVMSGASGQSEVASAFKAAPQATVLSLHNTTGFRANDLVLVTRKGSLDACLVEQVASVDIADVNAQKLNLGGTYYSAGVNQVNLVSSNFCSSASTAAALRSCGVLNLGNASTSPPSFLILGVGDNNTLFAYDILQTLSTAAVAVADSIFEMHALYGIDGDNDGKVDSWTTASGKYAPSALAAADGSGLSALCRIKAVRIGLITRSALAEKTAVSKSAMTLFENAAKYTRNFSEDEQKFRYQTIEATIPLRNMLSTACQSS